MAVENNTNRLLPHLRVHQELSKMYHQAILLHTERSELLKKKDDQMQTSIEQLSKQYADMLSKIMAVKQELSEIYAAMNFFHLVKVLEQKLDVAYIESEPAKDKIFLEKINKYSMGAYATLFQSPSTSSDDENNINDTHLGIHCPKTL